MQRFIAARRSALLVLAIYIFSASSAAADVVIDVKRSGRHGRNLLRAEQQDTTTVAVTTTAAPTTTDIGKANVRAAQDIAWKTAGEATETRAATSKLRAKINKRGAETYKDESAMNDAAAHNVYMPMIIQAQASAQASLNAALANEAKVHQVVQQVDQQAYNAARAAAQEEVMKLEKEAAKFYMDLKEKFKALAEPGPPTAAQTAAKASQPYIDVELRVKALVQYYNEQATSTIATATQATQQAQSIALTAQNEQRVGIVDMAQRHMMQAHMLIAAAQMKYQEALKVRKLAESLNMSIPSYQRAAQMAAAHALATFTGLQMQDKEQAEMETKLAESTRQVEKGLRDLEAALRVAEKAVDAAFSLDA
jgi:hypothetical protein